MARFIAFVFLSVASYAMAYAADITVDATGAGDFKTVQAAVDSVPANNPSRILIKPGTYAERITIAKEKQFISLVGLGKKAEETLLTYHLKAGDPKTGATRPSDTVGTTGSASTYIHGTDITSENLTFENSAGDNVGQAVAIKTTGDRLIFRNCRFFGFQDTLYPTGGRCYFKDCYVTGDTDFIFGNATAVFDHCTINSTDAGYVTAANTMPDQAFGYVFLDCTLTAPAGAKAGSTALGRPWQWNAGKIAAVTFIRTRIGPHISPAGWNPWDRGNTSPEKTTRYAEFGSMDLSGKPLDVSQRVTWSKQLTPDEAAKITVQSVLSGTDHWDPTTPPSP